MVINNCVSERKLVCSGVPQESVLRPQLFTIFIDDIYINIQSKVLKFANDTIVGKIVNYQFDAEKLQ